MRVSVLMPVFNGAKSMSAAVGSILTQTLEDFELIVVNDGSTDATSLVARSFSDPRVRVIDLAVNGGLINALNVGLGEARGEFLARMDHDDIAHPTRLQQQVDALVANDALICGSAIQPFGSIGGKAITFPLKDLEIRAVLPVVSPFAHPAVTMRTEVCRNLGYSPEARHCEDYDLWWRLANHGRMINLPAALLHYRFHADQISNVQRAKQLHGMATISVKNLCYDGRFRTVSDLACHQRALSYEPLASLDELIAIGEWLTWLRNSFGGLGEAPASHYLRVWRGVCSRQSHLGHGVWAIYKRFKPSGPELKADMLVLLSAYGGVDVDDPKVKALRRLFLR